MVCNFESGVVVGVESRQPCPSRINAKGGVGDPAPQIEEV
jgi:hypothetical protein